MTPFFLLFLFYITDLHRIEF
jgi:hypothetical protein